MKRVGPHIKACSVPDLKQEHNKDLAGEFRFVLNHYEFMCAGLRNGDFDEKLVKDSERGTIVGLFSCCEQYIYTLRDNRDRQSIYEHLEWIYNRWNVKRPGQLQALWERFRMQPIQGKRAEQKNGA